MKKENVYVKTKSREQADLYRNVLKEIGQTIREDFNTNTQLDDPDLDYRENGWILGYASASKKEITFGQLIDLLNELKKLAVKVENEKEFKAIEKHLGKKSFFTPPFQSVSYPAFIYLDGGKYQNKDFVSIDCGEIYLKDYQIIPFAEFAKEKGVKLPLLTSEDGVDLYEGDKVFYVHNSYGNKDWDFYMCNGFDGSATLSKMSDAITVPEYNKAFITKEAALSWIEAQKPKEIEIHLPFNGIQNFKALISNDKVVITSSTHHNPNQVHIYEFNKSWIEIIAKAIKK